MFLPARLFGSKNRRTPLQLTPRRLTGQSVDEQIRRMPPGGAALCIKPN